MRVKWNTSPGDCDGRLRETGKEYDDFSARALSDLLKNGSVSPVDNEARTLAASLTAKPVPTAPTPSDKPVPTDGESKE